MTEEYFNLDILSLPGLNNRLVGPISELQSVSPYLDSNYFDMEELFSEYFLL